MVSTLVPDELWEEVRLFLPAEPERRKGGRPKADSRTCLAGILFVLRSGCPWNSVPPELGSSGATCWRRLRHWEECGAWKNMFSVVQKHTREPLADGPLLESRDCSGLALPDIRVPCGGTTHMTAVEPPRMVTGATLGGVSEGGICPAPDTASGSV